MKKEKTNIKKAMKDSPYRLYRGGSWHWYYAKPPVRFRNWRDASDRLEDFGFRLVLQTKEKK